MQIHAQRFERQTDSYYKYRTRAQHPPTWSGLSKVYSMVHPIAEANEQSPYGELSPAEFYARHSVSHSSDFIINSRGLRLFAQSWTPLPPVKILGVVAVVHGFAAESSWLMELTAVHIAKS
uniref:Uncharacterized protein n=1 Tax=Kalanchoe fedtschenkoi TaxID=63787 RepID=A0A7N0TL30_KALFE